MSQSHTHNFEWKEVFTVKELDDSMVEITGDLPYAELESERTAALVALGKDVELDGFRKGHVPAPVLEKHLGEVAVLAEMAERAIAHAYPHIAEEHGLDVIGQPNIEVTKIAKDNPLGLKITVAVMPDITLPEYETIAAEVNKTRPTDEVTDEELTGKIEEIQKQKRAYDRMQELAKEQQDAAEKTDADAAELPTPESEAKKAKAAEDEEAPLPELTDEYVKTLGQPGQFETVADFKAKLREHIEIEKKQDNAAKHRAAITDAIIEKTDMTLPQVMIDSELGQMWAQMEEDIKRADLNMDDYLGHIKKTKEELFKEWTPAAEGRAKLQIILNEIAKKEDITPDMEKVEEQSKVLMERFKDADKGRVQLYVASVLMNEEVMKKLEALK